MLAVISKAPYGMTESQENSATAAHLLLFKLPGNHAFLKPVKYCLTPTYNHLSLLNAPMSEPACFIHLALK